MTNIEQYRHGDFGFLTIDEIVDDFMIHSFQDGRKYYPNMLRICADMWNRIYDKELRGFKSEYITVDKRTNSARLPIGYVRWYSLTAVDDCNNMQPLGYNEFYATTKKPKKDKGCGCKSCSCNSDLCGSMAGIDIAYEDIDFNGTIYQKVIKTKKCANGDIIQEIKEPYVKKNPDEEDSGDDTVDVIVYRTFNKFIAKVDVKSCGCVIDTPENKKKCVSACGCAVSCCTDKNNNTPLWTGNSKEGKFKIDTERGVIWLMGVKADKLILSHTSNGGKDCKNMLIPEYAKDALMAGMWWGSHRFRKGVSLGEKREMKREFTNEVQELLEFLWPIVPNDMIELESQFHKW